MSIIMKVTVLEICNDSDSTLICTNSEVCRGYGGSDFNFSKLHLQRGILSGPNCGGQVH